MDKKISILLMVFLLTVTTSTVIVSAAGTINIIKFNALVSGPCMVAYGIGEPGPDPIPPPEGIVYFGEGKGRATIIGNAKDLPDTKSDPLGWGDGYSSTNIKALGFVSVSWTDDKETKNWVFAILYSIPSTQGFFIPDTLFTLGLPGTEEPIYEENLQFIGIHVSGSEIQRIKGFAMYAIIPHEVLGQGDGHLNGVGLGIPIDDENLIIYQLWWSDNPGFPFGKPDVLQWNVEEG